MRTLLAIGCTCLGLAVTPLVASAQSKPPKELLGQYVITAGEDNGQKVPQSETKQMVRITPETITVVDHQGKDIYVAKYTLDTSSKPNKIAMTATGGPHVRIGETAKGIIEQEGNIVRLAYAPTGGAVPTEFSTKPESKQLMFVMKKTEQ